MKLLPRSAERWLRTRRAGSSVILLVLILILGTIITACALIYVMFFAGFHILDRLAVAGEFSSGVAAFFGLAGISSALIVTYVSQNRETHDAEQAWSAKLRLQEALVAYPLLIETECQLFASEHPEDPSFSGIGLTPIVQGALQQLAQALAGARQSGLIRIFSQLSLGAGSYDLGMELCVVEAHVQNDLKVHNPGIGQSVSAVIPDLLTHIGSIDYDDIAHVWDSPWHLTPKAISVAKLIAGS